MLDPKVHLKGATPEALVRALFRPLRPRAAGQPVVGDQPPVGQAPAHQPDDDGAHLVNRS